MTASYQGIYNKLFLLIFAGGARNTLAVVVVVKQRAVTVMVEVTMKKRVERSLVAVMVHPVPQTTAAAVTAIAVAGVILIQKLPLTQVDHDQQ